MNALEQAVFSASCLRHALPETFRPRSWIVWWPLIIAHGAWLAALVWFAHPAVAALMVPLLERLAGPEVLHYPNVFRVLPGLNARGAFVLLAVLGPVVAGAAALVFDDVFAGSRPAPGRALARAARRAPALIAAQLPLQLALLALTFGVSAWLEGRGSSGLTVRAFMLASLGAGVVAQSVFLYVPASVMLGGCGPLEAWREIPRAVGRAGVVALLLVAAAAVLGVPFQQAADMADPLVDRGRPEIMVAVVAAQVAFGLAVALVLTASSVLAYRSLLGPREDAP